MITGLRSLFLNSRASAKSRLSKPYSAEDAYLEIIQIEFA
jgi:hypothetical protein